jgi:hypothetical protein
MFCSFFYTSRKFTVYRTGLAVVGLGLNYLVARANVNKKAEAKAKK